MSMGSGRAVAMAMALAACVALLPPGSAQGAPAGRPLASASGTAQPAEADIEAQADALFEANRYTQALALYEQAQRSGIGPATRTLTLWQKIGCTQTKLRMFAEAIASFDQGLVIAAQAGELVLKYVEPVLRDARGEALRGLGKPELARADYTRAASIYRIQGDGLLLARMEAEIGSTYIDEANFSAALPHYVEARRRMEADPSPELQSVLVNMSSLLSWLGKYDEALALQEQAERACLAQHDVSCQALAALAQSFTRYHRGDHAASAAAARRALALLDASQAIERARASNNLGMALLALRRPREALVVLREANVRLARLAGNAKDQATITDSLARAYRQLGQYRTANRLYQDALLRWRVAGHREGERDTFASLGQLAADMRQPGLAIFYYKRSVNLAQSLRADSRALKGDYLDALTQRLKPSYLTLAGALVKQGRLAEAHQVLRMLKEQELFDALRGSGPAGETRAAATGPELAVGDAYEQRLQTLLTLTLELAQLAAREPDALTPHERDRLAEVRRLIRRESDILERFLVTMNRDLGRVDRAVVAIRNDQLEQLRITLGKLERGAVVLHYVPLADRLNIILTAGKALPIPYTVAVREQDLNTAIELFRDQVENRDPDVRVTAARLYRWLMPPALLRDLDDAGAKILMVSSAENLRYLPFGALFDGRQWLTERYAVSMFDDAATNALTTMPQAQWSMHAFGMTQAVGAFPALAWVRNELDAIVSTPGLPGKAEFDGQFTATSLRAALGPHPAPVLHIASHFVFSPSQEDESFLLLGVGRLSLRDIREMSFEGLDLLTLSACETAVGGGRNGNGAEVESFAALAQVRGADAVLASLWSVDDISTAAFMQRFYATRRSATTTKVEALQATQLAMIRREITPSSARTSLVRGTVEGRPEANAGLVTDYTHPFYWAPFVLSGNWL